MFSHSDLTTLIDSLEVPINTGKCHADFPDSRRSLSSVNSSPRVPHEGSFRETETSTTPVRRPWVGRYDHLPVGDPQSFPEVLQGRRLAGGPSYVRVRAARAIPFGSHVVNTGWVGCEGRLDLGSYAIPNQLSRGTWTTPAPGEDLVGVERGIPIEDLKD